MKTLKRTTIAILILTFLFSLAIPTMAVGTNDLKTITINNSKEGHVYGAYQIFTGSFSDDNFVNPAWGDDFDGTGFLSKLTTAPAPFEGAFADCESAADVAKILGDSSKIQAADVTLFANLAADYISETTTKTSTRKDDGTGYTIEVPTGYYLIKDDNTVTGHDAATMYVLDVTDDTDVTPKSDIPTVVKKVEEDTDVTDYTTLDANYNDVADWEIGQEKSFRLYATIPETAAMAGYETYKIVFHDTYCPGITVDTSDFTASYRIDGDETYFAEDTFAVTSDTTDKTITFTCNNLINAMGKENFLKNPTIVITYSAKLNAEANIGPNEGNPNEVYLEFTNDYYGDGTGKTPKDKVIVFTYEVGATKVDGDDHSKKLSGAEFVLMDNNNENNVSYAEVVDGKFVQWVSEPNENTTLISGNEGVFKIQGLDSGIYYLKETKAPTGYNLLTNLLKLEITAYEDSSTIYQQDWNFNDVTDAITKVELKVDGTVMEDGNNTPITEFEIENNSGFTLPETGGFGTTLIYIIGSILVIGVSVILITRKRMSNQDT